LLASFAECIHSLSVASSALRSFSRSTDGLQPLTKSTAAAERIETHVLMDRSFSFLRRVGAEYTPALPAR